jgi:hypothetical protein
MPQGPLPIPTDNILRFTILDSAPARETIGGHDMLTCPPVVMSRWLL